MRKNLFILGLICVIAVLIGTIWFKEDLKKDSATMAPATTTSSLSTTVKAEPKKTEAPVAPMSELNQKLQKLGFGPVANAHKITVK